jgi:hypothetical protein
MVPGKGWNIAQWQRFADEHIAYWNRRSRHTSNGNTSAEENEGSLAKFLMIVLLHVCEEIVAMGTPQSDSFNIADKVQLGFVVATLILEPQHAEEFMEKSATLVEKIVGYSPVKKKGKVSASKTIDIDRNVSARILAPLS